MRKIFIHAAITALAVFAAPIARAAYSNSVLALNPVAYWPLNESTSPGAGVTTATNLGSLGSAFNASFSGNVTFGVPGVIVSEANTADGFNQAQAQTPYTAAALSNSPSFTIEAWALSHNPGGGTQCVLSDVDANSPRSGWLLYMDGLNSGQYNFRTYNKNGTTPSLSLGIGAAGSIAADSWYHLAVVVSNAVTTNFVYAYVNGVLTDGPVGLPAFVPNDGGQGGFTIGARNDGGFRFSGNVDEVAYYSTALDGATILSHYTTATNASPANSYESLVHSSNPLLYFRLDEPNNLPVAHNYGTLGSSANGNYQAGTVPGVPGPNFSGLPNGLGANNFACQFSPGGTQSSTSPGPGVACAAYQPDVLNEVGTVTLSAWVMVPTGAVGWFTGPCGRGDSSYRFGLDTGGQPHFADGGNPDIVGGVAVNDGTWHLWTGVYNSVNSNASFYIDASLVASGTWSAPSGSSDNQFFIGGAPDYIGRNFVGDVCQVAIFTNALASSQVKNLYYAAAPPQVAQAVAALGPAAYWPLSETQQPPAAATIPSGVNLGTLGTGANATFTGDMVFGYPGALAGDTDSADGFNGGNSLAQVSFLPDLGNAPSFSIEAWLLAHDDGTVAGTRCPVSDIDAANPRSGWLIYLDIANPGQYTFRAYDTNGTTPSLSFNIGAAGSIQKEHWYHLTVVVSNAVTVTNVYGYIDGALVAGPVVLPAYVPNDGANGGFSIGARADGGFIWSGAIDEVAYYTNALDPATVLAHYQAGTNAHPATAYSSLVLQSNPLLYYRMDEVPALSGPYPVPLPVAMNIGSFGSAANGYYQPGTFPGIAGPTNIGFGPTSLSCGFSTNNVQASATAGPGVMCAPYSQGLLNASSAISLVAWIQVPSTSLTWFQTPIGRGDRSYRFDVDNPGGLPHFAANPNGDVVGTVGVDDGLWHHWAGVFNSVTKQSLLYIDGLQVAGASGSALTDLANYLLIGGAPDYKNRNFVGDICQVALFTNALSQAQIQNLFNIAGVPPAVLLSTNQLTINQGANGTLTSQVSGTLPLSLQWYFVNTMSVTNLAVGQTTSTLSLTNVQASQDTEQYFLVANNAYGAVTSAVVTLTVKQGPPTVQVDISPLFATVPAGAEVSYTFQVTGTLPFYYQWYDNGVPVSDATNALFTFAAPAGSNYFYCIVTNNFGPVTSSTASIIGATTAPPVITFNGNGTGWMVNGTVTVGVTNGTLLLTDGGGGEATSFFYTNAQYIGGFVSSFTYQEAPGTAPLADGTTFCIQNSPAGAQAVGGGGGDLGFFGISPSAAFEMNIYNGANGNIGIQFGTNGMTADSTPATPPYFSSSPVNLASGDPINVRLYYQAGVLDVLMVDATTNISYTTVLDVGDLTAVLGGDVAFVGFTGATGGANSIQTVSNFNYSYTTAPLLAVSKNGANAVITWPVSVSTSFVLQQASSIAGPWANYTGTPPTIVNLQNQVTLSNLGTLQFYRLLLQ